MSLPGSPDDGHRVDLGRFDPDSDFTEGALFGLPHGLDQARVRVIPVPWEATVSYGRGTSRAPERIRAASAQVDLHDLETGAPWRAGFAMEEPDPRLEEWNAEACELVDRVHASPEDPAADGLRQRVDALGARVNQLVQNRVDGALQAQRIPVVLGGDHAVAFGGLAAAARAEPGIGVLHIDAHCDLRPAYEGFTWSHASVMHNALERCDIGPLVQVGIRDLGAAEHARACDEERVQLWTDLALGRALAEGRSFAALVDQMLAPLPATVWVSLDVDGLDPSLAPNTGTPVPGGLSWREALFLLGALGRSERRILGFDIVETGDGEFDANVAARLLYKLGGWAIRGRGR